MIENSVEILNNKNIEKLLNDSVSFLEKGYLSKRENFEIVKIPVRMSELSFSIGIRLLHLTKFTYEEKENILDKLSNIFTSLYGSKTSIFLILDSDGKNCNFYLGVRNEEAISQSFSTLKASLNGNFPGVEYKDNIETIKIEKLMNDILKQEIMEISSVTGVPSLKSENKDMFLQGIEKVVNGMEGKSFSALFIANPIEYDEIKDIKKGYEELYNQLFPYVNMSISLNKSEAIALTESIGETISKGYSKNLSKTDTINRNFTKGRNNSESIGGGLFFNKTNSEGRSSSETEGKNFSDTVGETYSKGTASQEIISDTKTDTFGKTLQINQKNKSLENLVKKIEKHIERIETAEGNGMWNIGTYFLSEEPQNSIVAANIYNGIIRGKTSGIERNAVCTFNIENDLEEIKDYLYNFANPILKVKMLEEDIYTSMGSLVTNDELPLKLNFPQKSVAGLDVIKMASFGRNKKISKENKEVEIGNLYHLGKIYNSKIGLDLESLSSHTFITGSTGSGKSNVVYCILEELYKNDIKFLVIEPAKGEYKNIFGGKHNVNVYGTNNRFTELLKINPFSFNEEIHILEHIDCLTEIFNACWSMYAAMPAILKDAIEKAYVMVGWDLKLSTNLYGQRKFPTLKHLKNSLHEVINNSSYSQESKSNYIGALVTRVNSMDNGLIGNIFSENELSEKRLFDENVIVDISRIPSSESKALIMGIMIMKLKEYRISNSIEENLKLKHITVLEEAHNLLKRTSTEQSSEASNLQGKSVEMLTNAIAEMRTYGEGFIIADQAPGLLDLAVIRNTNTKICLRLPSLDDRRVVGNAMNLNEEQIEELAKLDTGVAAIIQPNFKESCLVKFNYMTNKNKLVYKVEDKSPLLLKNTLRYLLEKKLPKDEKLDSSSKDEVIKEMSSKNINFEELNEKDIDKYIYEVLDGKKILNIINSTSSEDIAEWNNRIEIILMNILNLNQADCFFRTEISNSIIRENTLRNPEYLNFYKEWDEFLKDGRNI